MNRFPFILIAVLALFSCGRSNDSTLFTLQEKTGIEFSNNIKETKEFNVFKYRNFYNGGGVAAGDLNNDGLPDLFFTANQGANKLYLNKGNFQFEDISAKAGFGDKKQWSTGVVLVDVNADGWLDIYVCNAGNMFDPALRRNQLFINNHNLTFTEQATAYGLDNDGYSTQASFFDYDLDGDLDCFIVNNSPIPVNTLNYSNTRDLPSKDWTSVAEFLRGGGDHLYRNDNGHYNEVSAQAGIHGGLISLGLGVTVGDVNKDGYPDIYVSNDFFERDYLYINQRNGTFSDQLESLTQHISLSSMGADMQDINNDGYPDIFTTDMLPDDDYRLKANTSFENYDVFKLKQSKDFYNQFTQNCLQVNDGNGRFKETAFYSGIAASDWSWGALIFDGDNDGLQDVMVCNGIYRDVTDQDFVDFFANEVVQDMMISGKKEDVNTITEKMPSTPIPNKLFHNKGVLRFAEEGKSWGLDAASFSNGAAYADIDNDGDLDLVVNNVNQKAFVYRNNSREKNAGHAISVKLHYKTPNPFAIGSTITVFAGKQLLSREIMPSRGFQSSVDYRQVIGIGNLRPDSLQVTWPDQTVQTLLPPFSDSVLNISYQSPHVKPVPAATPATALLSLQASAFDKHQEDDYVDFYYERNIPFMLSKLGPKAAAADVNGDGMEDIYIGGARQQAGQLYLQTAAGFVKKPVPDFTTYAFSDVTAALFVDCDGDGDMDLFTGGGGNFDAATSNNFQNQLYLNDGKGNFTLSRGALPISNTNCGAVVALDYNHDDAMDLFIAGRSVPQDYGTNAPAALLQNDGKGHYHNVTAQVAPDLQRPGMVSSVLYKDLTGDGKEELVLAGDWMYPMVLSYDGNKFKSISTGLENNWGWWQSMTAADMDGDGDIDLVLGNIGENFYLHADETNPVKLWIKDFDQNQMADKIFTKTVNGKNIPVFTKREITDQIPGLKKLNLKHHDYATKTVEQLFGKDIEGATVKQVNYPYSCIAINDGKGHFTLQKLPLSLQLSSVNALAVTDVNGDGKNDIVAAGNFFDLLPQFCRLDGSYGNILLNDGKGHFTEVPQSATGLVLKGQIRGILPVHIKNKTSLLFCQNNEVPVLYQINSSTK